MSNKKRIYIYINLIIKTIIITIIILLGTFPACVCCPAGVSLGKQELVKTFTARQKLASLAGAGKLAGDGSGVGGGAVLGDVLIKE